MGIVGVDFALIVGIKTLDYGTIHLYSDSWAYNETWGSTWITEIIDPVTLEEYGGSPIPHDHTAVEVPWQQRVLSDT